MARLREFRWGAQILPDPDPDMTPEEVRDYYAAVYPELTTAVVQSEEGADGQVTFAKPEGRAQAPVRATAGAGKAVHTFKQSQGARG